MKLVRFSGLIGILLATNAAHAAGPGDDFFTFIGLSQSISLTIVNPYSSATITINGIFNVNQGTYDGLGGIDTIVSSNLSDFILIDDSGIQKVANIEYFQGGDGDDVIHFASLNFPLSDLIVFAGEGHDIIWSNSGNDLISGAGGNDIIDGGPGNDIINGEDGDDWIRGGVGIDIAGYSYPLNEYSIVRISASGLRVSHPIEGIDILEGTEFIGYNCGFNGCSETLDTSAVPNAVPEPSTFLMMGTAIGVFWSKRRRRNRFLSSSASS